MSRTHHEQDVFKQSNNEPDHRIENGDNAIQGADTKALEQPVGVKPASDQDQMLVARFLLIGDPKTRAAHRNDDAGSVHLDVESVHPASLAETSAGRSRRPQAMRWAD